MKFTCTHYVNTPPEEVGQHQEHLNLTAEKTALLLVNVYGLLLPEEHPAHQALVSIYGREEVSRRELLVRNNLLPVMKAARDAGMTLIYVADSSPNIGMENTHIRDVMLKNMDIDQLVQYAENCNEKQE